MRNLFAALIATTTTLHLGGCMMTVDPLAATEANFQSQAEGGAGTYTLANTQAGARPGDEAMTCQKIGLEMQGRMQGAKQMGADMKDSGGAALREIRKIRQEAMASAAPAAAATTAADIAATMAEAAGIPGAGLASQAVATANAAAQARRAEVYEQRMRPLVDRMAGDVQANQATIQQIASDPRLQRLSALAEAKNCQ